MKPGMPTLNRPTKSPFAGELVLSEPELISLSDRYRAD